MENLLESTVRQSSSWVEARFQERRSLVLSVRNGHFDQCSTVRASGVGIRALVGGAFGFASTTDLSERGLRNAVSAASALADATPRGGGAGPRAPPRPVPR
jgi:TldD protein